MHQVKKLVINWLRLVKTGNWSRPVQDHKKTGPEQSSPVFDLLGPWWTGLSLGPCPRKAKTGLDQTSKHYSNLGFILMALSDIDYVLSKVSINPPQ